MISLYFEYVTLPSLFKSIEERARSSSIRVWLRIFTLMSFAVISFCATKKRRDLCRHLEQTYGNKEDYETGKLLIYNGNNLKLKSLFENIFPLPTFFSQFSPTTSPMNKIVSHRTWSEQ